MESLIVAPIKVINPTNIDWYSQSLRSCLHFLGISDDEMRFRKGARRIIESWKDQENDLLELIKRKWKKQVVLYHEAAQNGDVEKWKEINTVYSAAVRKISSYLPKVKNRNCKIEYFTCKFCGKTFSKKIISHFQYKSFLCGDIKCTREYRKQKSYNYRKKLKTTFERTCTCGRRFFTTVSKKKYCCRECWNNDYLLRNESKLKEQQKIRQQRRTSWKEMFSRLTEEQKQEYRKKHRLQKQKRIESETPEQRKIRLQEKAKEMREYRKKRILEGRPIKTNYIPRKEWLEKKRLQYIDKPWIYETILQMEKNGQ